MPSDKWEAELGSVGLMIYEGTLSWEGVSGGGREGRQSVGPHSQPIKAAASTLMGDHIPRYISSREGCGVWRLSPGRDRRTPWGLSCLWGVWAV